MSVTNVSYCLASAGVENIVACMPHRGRLSLLTDLLQLSPTALFHKIKGGSEIPDDLGATADVVSHLASSPTLQYDGASKPIHVSLLQNPSHLGVSARAYKLALPKQILTKMTCVSVVVVVEAINPVAMGKARAKQFALVRDAALDCALGDKVMCVQLHGDAAFTGQGVVMETLGLSTLTFHLFPYLGLLSDQASYALTMAWQVIYRTIQLVALFIS